MDALVPAFVAAALAEVGDKTQLVTIALATKFGRPALILGGVAAAALANSLIAAGGGWLLAGRLTPEAVTLLVALALLSAAIAGFSRVKPATPKTWRFGALAGSALAFFLAEFGDRTQFVTAAIAARADSLTFAALGAAAGIVAANVPAALLGATLAETVPLATIRRIASILFLIAGLWIGLGALRLI